LLSTSLLSSSFLSGSLLEGFLLLARQAGFVLFLKLQRFRFGWRWRWRRRRGRLGDWRRRDFGCLGAFCLLWRCHSVAFDFRFLDLLGSFCFRFVCHYFLDNDLSTPVAMVSMAREGPREEIAFRARGRYRTS
jgi:hypothetical protein